MNNVTLIENGNRNAGRPTVYTGPASWDELTPAQYLQYCRAVDKFGGGMETLFGLFSIWYNLNVHTLNRLTDEQRGNLLDLLAFLDVRPARWMLPVLTGAIGQWDWRGPGDALEHLTFAEFIYAEAALEQVLANPDSYTFPARLTACLYRPYHPDRDGDRSAFVPRLLDRQTEQALGLSRAELAGVVMNYLGCKDQFPTDYPHLFNRSTSGSGEGGNWVDVGLSLARQTGALGSFQQLEQTSLHLALTALDQIIKEQKELEKRLAKHGRSD